MNGKNRLGTRKRAKSIRSKRRKVLDHAIKRNDVPAAMTALQRLRATLNWQVAEGLFEPRAASDQVRRARRQVDDLRSRHPDVFLAALRQDGVLTDLEAAALRPFRIQDARDLMLLLQTKSLPETLDVTRVSRELQFRFPEDAQLAVAAKQELEESGEFAFGAAPPPTDGAPDSLADPAPRAPNERSPRRERCGGDDCSGGEQIVPGNDVMLEGIDRWIAKDQGRRGTCVSFATSACLEHAHQLAHQRSEQFLHWAIKTRRHENPEIEDCGTYLKWAAAATCADGVCTESYWPYDARKRPPDWGHANPGPSAAAIANANDNRTDPSALWVSSRWDAAGWASNPAQRLYERLKQGSPVAVSLLVYQFDGETNWTQASAAYGEVIDPVEGEPWVAAGGHAVCVVGYKVDRLAAGGGVFVFRNSWGQRFGQRLPDPGRGRYHGPRPGYGQVSAAYVCQNAFELLQVLPGPNI